MEPLISVIIPVYKVEKYIEHCLRSVMNQTYSRLEIIAVDDGSPDKSGEICDRLALEDDRLRVYHKENGGVSSARNFGLDHASGDYIAYIDSDDYVAENYIEYLVELVQSFGADIACCDLKKVSTQSEQIQDMEQSYFCCSGYETCRLMLTERELQLSVPCAKIIAAELARRFKFPDGKTFEDTRTTYKYYYYCDKVAVGDAKLYAYYMNSYGISASDFRFENGQRAEAQVERAKFFEDKGERTLARLAWNLALNVLYASSYSSGGKYNREIKSIIKSRWYKGCIGIFTLAKCCALVWFPKLYKKVRALIRK